MLAYGDNIFMNASQQTVVQGFNYVPKGVDKEITNRLGFQLIGTGMLVPGTEKNCANGICAGICAVWIAAFISRNASAINHSNFNSYFKHYLRFQGAYVQDINDTSRSLGVLLNTLNVYNSNLPSNTIYTPPGFIVSTIPFGDSDWVGFLGFARHAISIAYQVGSYYIMDPNYGLFEYNKRSLFVCDLVLYISAIRRYKKIDSSGRVQLSFYHRRGI